MNLDAYDDMMGLEFGDYEGLAGLLDPEMLKEALIASTAGGGAILLATWGVKQLAEKLGAAKIENPLLRAVAVSGSTFVLGVMAGRQVMKYNLNAGIGIIGAIGGMAMANLLDAGIAQVTGNARIFSALGDDMLSEYSESDGMAALAALETTDVESAPGAFSGFADPSVTPEQLMGFESAVVQQETLGGYMPWNA